jgi:hypothetical protein
MSGNAKDFEISFEQAKPQKPPKPALPFLSAGPIPQFPTDRQALLVHRFVEEGDRTLDARFSRLSRCLLKVSIRPM